MWQEGQEDLFDDVPESFILCALHQAKIIRERWKYWSGSVPANVSIRLHRLESLLSINEEVRQQRSVSAIMQQNKKSIQSSSNNHHPIEIPCSIPLQQMSNINSSQPFLADIRNTYLTERIEPKRNIIIQGPDLRRNIVKQKRHFWCCH